MPSVFTREELQERLEDACRTLLALPGGAMQARLGSGMPTPVRKFEEAYNRHAVQTRLPAPSAESITLMDEALAWISLIPATPGRPGSGERYSTHGGVVLRKIVGARSMVSPYDGRYLYSWRAVGEMIGADHKSVQRWHGAALGLILTRLAPHHGRMVA
jgi:hypothetical protein